MLAPASSPIFRNTQSAIRNTHFKQAGWEMRTLSPRIAAYRRLFLGNRRIAGPRAAGLNAPERVRKLLRQETFWGK